MAAALGGTIGCSAAGGETQESPEDARTVEASSAIYNGSHVQNTEPGAAGVVINVEHGPFTDVCTGTLISPTVVLTSKACLRAYNVLLLPHSVSTPTLTSSCVLGHPSLNLGLMYLPSAVNDVPGVTVDDPGPSDVGNGVDIIGWIDGQNAQHPPPTMMVGTTAIRALLPLAPKTPTRIAMVDYWMVEMGEQGGCLFRHGTNECIGVSRNGYPHDMNDAAWITSHLAVPSGCCGNGVVEVGEGCDDGNAVDSDGCSSACLVEDP